MKKRTLTVCTLLILLVTLLGGTVQAEGEPIMEKQMGDALKVPQEIITTFKDTYNYDAETLSEDYLTKIKNAQSFVKIFRSGLRWKFANNRGENAAEVIQNLSDLSIDYLGLDKENKVVSGFGFKDNKAEVRKSHFESSAALQQLLVEAQNSQAVLDQIPGKPTATNVYCFYSKTTHIEELILYFETSQGDYVLFHTDEYEPAVLFTLEDFKTYSDAWWAVRKTKIFDKDGQLLYGSPVDTVKAADYASYAHKDIGSQGIKWYHIVVGAVLVVGLVTGTVLLVRCGKKGKKDEKGESAQ